jgi:hypothetical protein
MLGNDLPPPSRRGDCQGPSPDYSNLSPQDYRPGHASQSPRNSDLDLPLVYDELRRLAAAQMAREKTGQTLADTR